MPIKIMASILISLSLTACFGWKPFQPNPPSFTQWAKDEVSADGVKDVMRQCGYKDIYGYGGDRHSTMDERAARQNCMFRNGFKRKDGYKGICSLQGTQNLPACQPDTQPQQEAP